MKAKRQALIREIVEAQSIQTQEELAEALRMHGMMVTQATVSPMCCIFASKSSGTSNTTTSAPFLRHRDSCASI